MDNLEKQFNSIVSTIDVEDFSLLIDIEEKTSQGLLYLINYLTSCGGNISSIDLDLILALQSILNNSDFDYTFEETERVLAVGSEMFLLTVVSDQQTVEQVELGSHSPALALLYDNYDLTLSSSITLSNMNDANYINNETLASLSLYGHWEEYAMAVVRGILATGTTERRTNELHAYVSHSEPRFTPDIAFMDLLDILGQTKLLTTTVSSKGISYVRLKVPATGFFLVFSGNHDEAYRLSEITS